ncbi:MAG: hypothetical protein LUF68_09395 [Clostridiales bacterium]|nr:hypothetical protein [Clostridiales bacterium]
MKSMLLSVLLNANYEKECIQAVFDIVGKGDYYADVICDNEVVLEKEYIPLDKILNMIIPIKYAKYTVKVFEMEGGEFGFDDDYTYIGQNEMQLLNRSELNGAAFNIDSIVSIDRKDIVRLRLKYQYTTFIEKKVNRHMYRGMLVEIYHDDTVSRAFPVYIHIPNLNAITQMTILLEDREYEEESEFLYDIYKQCLVDNQDSKYGKAEAYRRYAYVLFQESFIWYCHFTTFNQSMYLKGVKWLQEKTNRNKNSSIWKDGNNENDDISKKSKDNSIVFGRTDISIEELNLSKRSYNCLIRAKIYTVEQALKRIEDGSIIKVRNLGRKCVEEIIEKIDKLNKK